MKKEIDIFHDLSSFGVNEALIVFILYLKSNF